MDNISFKVHFVGDHRTGKTCLCNLFLHQDFNFEYISTICQPFEKDFTAFGWAFSVYVLEDNGHGEDYDRLRPLGYPQTDTFIALFSVTSRESFNNVKSRWIPEVRSYLPNTPVLIVANKIELRDSVADCVTYAEGYAMAREMGTGYHEVSCRENRGIDECFTLATEIAMLNSKEVRKQLKVSSMLFPHIKPPFPPEPVVKALPSTLSEDWSQLIDNPLFHDVKLVIEDKPILCHKLFLCQSSSLCKRLLLTTSPSDTLETLVAKGSFSPIQRKAIVSFEHDDKTQEVTIGFGADVARLTVLTALKYIYAGVTPSSSLDAKEIAALDRVAQIFELRDLLRLCDKMMQEKTSTEESEVSNVPEEPAESEKYSPVSQCFNQELLSDVVFIVEEHRLPAHKLVVSTRCPKLFDLLSQHVPENQETNDSTCLEVPMKDVSIENFKLLLRFLYADEISLDSTNDAVGLAHLALKFDLGRLFSFCEVFFRQDVKAMEAKLSEEELLNAVDLLLKYKSLHSAQMESWCLHYISHRYTQFVDTEDYSCLDQDIKDHIEKDRWPSPEQLKRMEEIERIVSFMKDGKQFKTSNSNSNKKCVVS